MKSTILLTAIILTGLSAGLFYAWQVSIIPGTKKVSDLTYLESMQSINREILNPWFFIIFFGPLLLMIVSAIELHKLDDTQAFAIVLIAAVIYVIGTIGVTSFGNVPLNNALEAKTLTGFSLEELKGLREAYESKWNQLHVIRTIFSVISFAMLLWASKVYFMASSTNL